MNNFCEINQVIFYCGVFSLLGTLYVFISCLILRSKHESQAPKLFLTHHVVWLSFCSILVNVWLLLNWSQFFFSPCEDPHLWSNTICSILGIICEFAFGNYFSV